MAVANQNGSVLLWSLAPDGQPHILGGRITDIPASDMTYVADGSVLYAAGTDGLLHIWDVTDPSHPHSIDLAIDLDNPKEFGEVLETTHTGEECGSAAVQDPESGAGCRLAIAGSSGQVKIFDVTDARNPELLAGFTAHPGIPVHDMQFSDDGSLLVTGGENGDVYIWGAAEPREQPRRVGRRLAGHTQAVRDVQFDENGRDLLATASDDGTVILWDVAHPQDPRQLGVLTDPRGPVNDVTFSRDGQTLFAASDDGNVWGWDVSRADQPTPLDRPLTDHLGPVYDMSLIGPHILATASEDSRVLFWDISDAHHPRRLGPVITHSDGVVDTNVAQEINRMAVAGEDQTIRLWDVSPLLAGIPDNVAELACARVGSGLSEDDWETYIPDLPYRQTC